MSIAAETPSAIEPGPRPLIRPSLIYFWTVSLVWFALFGWNLVRHGHELASHSTALIPWVALLAVVNMLPVSTWPHANFTPDVPIFIAGTLVLSPIEIGIASFIGGFDRKELNGQITLSKAVFNRSQVGLAGFASSLVAHHVVPWPGPSGFILLLAVLVLVAIFLVNYILVGVAIALEYGAGPRTVLKRMSVGTPLDFALTLISWGVVGAMLAVLYDQIGPVALFAFLAPTLLGRQALARSQMSLDTARAYRSREAALTEMEHRIHEERSDERKLIAADLHDEVVQPLFKVTLMAQVLKTDLATGKLLEIEEDLPELLGAAELASTSLRELIGDLRRSRVGSAGLASAIRALIRISCQNTAASVDVNVEAVSADEDMELVIYHLVREALTNAIRHSRASRIWVDVHENGKELDVSVRDNGIGFDVLIERESHYGIQIMQERVRSVGGDIYLDSEPGKGTLITARLPRAKNS